MLDAHFGDVGRGHGKAGAQQRSPRDLDPRSDPGGDPHAALTFGGFVAPRHRALYRLPRPCPDSDAAQYIADRLTENISDPGAPSHEQS